MSYRFVANGVAFKGFVNILAVVAYVYKGILAQRYSAFHLVGIADYIPILHRVESIGLVDSDQQQTDKVLR